MAIHISRRILNQICLYIREIPISKKITGFINIREVHFQWPIGSWALDPKLKKVGEIFRDDLDVTLERLRRDCLWVR